MATFRNTGADPNGVVGWSDTHNGNGTVGLNTDTTARNVENPSGHGVFGGTMVPDGAGVVGVHAGEGAGSAGLGRVGVWGGSVNGVGVVGASAPRGAKGGDGVHGITNSEGQNGIFGINLSTEKRNPDRYSRGNGVYGFTYVPDGAGVMGVAHTGVAGVCGLGGAGASIGVMGTSSNIGVFGKGSFAGVFGMRDGPGYAGAFFGPVWVRGITLVEGEIRVRSSNGEALHAETQSTTVSAIAAFQNDSGSTAAAFYAKHAGGSGHPAAMFDGDVVVTGDIVLTDAADCAEDFDVADGQDAEPGTVMVLNAEGRLEPSSQAYDKRVVGVVSGAAPFKTGIVLDKRPDSLARRPIALMGKVLCKVDADLGSVEAGDLLTSSPTPGHAMRANPGPAAFGSVIGKAMQPLKQGQGLIALLVALQ